jgi:DNA-directed RNA polymerase specialized sigma24 family protein
MPPEQKLQPRIEMEIERVSNGSWLTRKQAGVLVLRQEGWTHPEIADALEITTTASQSILYDVRHRYQFFRSGTEFLDEEFPELLPDE